MQTGLLKYLALITLPRQRVVYLIEELDAHILGPTPFLKPWDELKTVVSELIDTSKVRQGSAEEANIRL